MCVCMYVCMYLCMYVLLSYYNYIYYISGKDHEWNGVVEGVTDLVSAGSAILASLLKVNWFAWGELTIGIFSLIQSMLLLISSNTRIIWVAYGNHVIYRASFAFMITIVR